MLAEKCFQKRCPNVGRAWNGRESYVKVSEGVEKMFTGVGLRVVRCYFIYFLSNDFTIFCKGLLRYIDVRHKLIGNVPSRGC